MTTWHCLNVSCLQLTHKNEWNGTINFTTCTVSEISCHSADNGLFPQFHFIMQPASQACIGFVAWLWTVKLPRGLWASSDCIGTGAVRCLLQSFAVKRYRFDLSSYCNSKTKFRTEDQTPCNSTHTPQRWAITSSFYPEVTSWQCGSWKMMT